MLKRKLWTFRERLLRAWQISPFSPRGAPFRLRARRGEVTETLAWAPRETAVIICDMWDAHWCRRAAERCSLLAHQVERFACAARKQGALVIHAPSDTMSFYAGMPQRERARQVKRVKPALPIRMRPIDPEKESQLPIVDSDGGCDDELPRPNFSTAPWTRQHPAIAVAAHDIISDDGKEIYSILVRSGIKNIFMTGVHTNKCVLARPFGIRQMVLLGMNVVLVRDLTDSLYNPSMPPRVSHEQGTILVVEHIEKYWCPSISGEDVTSLE